MPRVVFAARASVFLLLAGSISFNSISLRPLHAESPKSIAFKPSLRVVKRTQHGKVSLEIPVLRGLKARAFQARINTSLADLINKDAEEFEAGYKVFPADKYGTKKHLRVDWSFAEAHKSERFLSIALTRYEFGGGAHGMSGTHVFTYDLKKKRAIKLDELFQPGGAYLRRLSKLSKKYLGARVLWPQGIAPKRDNFRTFVITGKGLKLFFGSYQIAPYASGPSEIIIPWRELNNVLRPSLR